MKYVVFAVAAFGIPPLTALFCLNLRWMKLAFWAMFVAMCLYGATSINFFSYEQYRGTSRGMEIGLISLLDVAMLSAMALRGKVKKLMPDGGARCFAIYFLLCLPSIFVADNLLFSWFEVWKMILVFLHFLAVYWYLRVTDDAKPVFWALLAFVVVNGLAVVKAHYSGVFQPSGVFPHRNGMAMGMLLLGPVFLAAYLTHGLGTWFGRCSALAFVFAAGSTVWSYSRGAIAMIPIAYGITILACFSERRGALRKLKRLAPIALAGLVGLALVMPRVIDRFANAPKSSGATRVELAACAWEMIRDRPLTGVGINNWSLNMDPVHPYQDRAADALDADLNYGGIVETVYLLVCAECGVPALIAMLAWFAWYWLLCLRLLRRLKQTKWLFVPAGLLGGLTANYLQSALEWVLRQQLSLVCLMFAFAVLSYLNAESQRLAPKEEASER